jgi:hypothetical protein
MYKSRILVINENTFYFHVRTLARWTSTLPSFSSFPHKHTHVSRHSHHHFDSVFIQWLVTRALQAITVLLRNVSSNVSQVLALDVLGSSRIGLRAEAFLGRTHFEWYFANCPSGPGGRYGSYSNNPNLMDMHTYHKYVIDFSRFNHEFQVNECFRLHNACVLRNAKVSHPPLDPNFVVHTGGRRHVTVMPPKWQFPVTFPRTSWVQSHALNK